MTMVIDASMALAWIYERQNPDEAHCAERALKVSSATKTIVPALWHTEIANGLLVGERRKVVTEALVIDYLRRLDNLPIAVHDQAPGARRTQIMALAREYNLTAYDATYLDLALHMGAVLATFDGKLAMAMRGAGGTVFE